MRRLAALLASLVATAASAEPLTAFYVPWEKPALASLKAHVGDIAVFAPFWGSLVAPSGKIIWEDDPEAHLVLRQAKRPPKVIPIVSNAHDDVWDKAAAEAVILKPPAADAFAANILKQAQSDHLAGVVVDFENLGPKATAGFPAFLKGLRTRLNAAGLEVWVTTTLTHEDGYPDLSDAADAVVLMAYDQCWATSYPGPIAADAWIAANLKAKVAGRDPSRYVVALASYAYDWPATGKATVISAGKAAQLARANGAKVVHAPGSNPHFSYQAAGVRHEVWWVGAADVARQRALVASQGFRGTALWRMGLEDPNLWRATAAAPAKPQGPAASCEPAKP
jgi:spore germination protein YaaH